tara:strand:- start:7 stop:342 length:336 start_codon:yes stop_codon:yes gene_type:complete
MSKLNTKIKLYLEANSKVYINEKSNYLVRNDSDGNGDYLYSWNVNGLAQPTAEQIASYESAGNTAETLAGVLNKRKKEYPSITDQLDKIYHDGVDEWKKVIKKVKDDNPKG